MDASEIGLNKILHLFLFALLCDETSAAEAPKYHTICKLAESDLLGTTVQHWDLFTIAEEVSLRRDKRFRERTIQEDPCMCLLVSMHMDTRHG